MKEVTCPKCQGSGDIPAPSGSGMMICYVCSGRGMIDEHDLEWKRKWAATAEPKTKAARAKKDTGMTAKSTGVAKAPPRRKTVKPETPVIDTGRTPLHQEASDGFLRGVNELLASGADVNARDNNGRTPLHWPSYRGHLEVVRLLVEHGADVNAADQEGRTPLRMATIGNHPEVVTYLTEHGGRL